MLVPSELARLEAVESLANRAILAALEAQAGGRNRAASEPAAATTPGQATITAVGAAKLITSASGLFFFTCSVVVTGVAADVITLTVQTETDNVAGVPLTLNNAGQIGPGTNGIAQPGNVAVANNGAFSSTTGAGITVTGGSAPVGMISEAVTVPTGGGGTLLTWSGVLQKATVAASFSPFAIGTTCLALVSITDSVAARAVPSISLAMFELP